MKRTFIFHPFLLLIYLILMLYNNNIGYLTLDVIFRPIIFALCFVFVLLLLTVLFFRDFQKAGIFVEVFLFLFISYQTFFERFNKWAIMNNNVLMIRYFESFILLTYLAFFAYGIRKIRKKIALNITVVMNTITIVLVMFPLYNISAHEVQKRVIWKHNHVIKEINNGTTYKENGKLPNIYYIILDGYARNDVLREVYNYDNSVFWDYLNQEGFYIATKSRSNYNQTFLSLASSLNLQYLNDLLIDFDKNSFDRYSLYSLIRDNSVMRFLRRYDYKFVTFSSPFSALDIKGSDIYKTTGFHLNELENLILNVSPLSTILNKLGFLNQFNLHRQNILHTLNCLANMSEQEGPYFIYAHIAAPHPPFVFDRDGGKSNSKRTFSFNEGSTFEGTKIEYRESYLDQLIFITSQIKSVINIILTKSKRPPIVIIQSDHGPGSLFNLESLEDTYLKERFSILNAYYLPDYNQEDLYEEITPVNTFRLIFNIYFGTDYDLLGDRSYFSRWSYPYECIDVTKSIGTESDMNQIKIRK